MRNFTLTIHIETDDADDIVEKDIRDLFYDAGGDMPFSFDITEIKQDEQ
ncbi:hypothetical protein OG785_45880 [Streptomyces sp. NBC_00006]|nr:hypothetical protein [Streptomyces sp. NBC_00006]MCX5537697.1 hypothetical protein [Streptomyces sp. NBC_00006]MCX5537892.1 hypothetical protein [Streptomyces sp. NBC_00006]